MKINLQKHNPNNQQWSGKMKITLKNTKKEIFEAYQRDKDIREERNVLIYISIILFTFNCLF